MHIRKVDIGDRHYAYLQVGASALVHQTSRDDCSQNSFDITTFLMSDALILRGIPNTGLHLRISFIPIGNAMVLTNFSGHPVEVPHQVGSTVLKRLVQATFSSKYLKVIWTVKDEFDDPYKICLELELQFSEAGIVTPNLLKVTLSAND